MVVFSKKMFLLGNSNIGDEVALELEKNDAYQSDFDEDDFFNFTCIIFSKKLKVKFYILISIL